MTGIYPLFGVMIMNTAIRLVLLFCLLAGCARQPTVPSTASPPATRTAAQWEDEADRLTSAEDWPGLESLARDWTQAQPANASAWFTLGLALHRQKQYARAIEGTPLPTSCLLA